MAPTYNGPRADQHQQEPVKFQDPKCWATRKELSTHPKWHVNFIIVANRAGLQHFLQPTVLRESFADATIGLRRLNQPLKQLRTCVDTKRNLQGLYPPRGFTESKQGTSKLWSQQQLPTETALQQQLEDNVIKVTKLLHCPESIIHTGGSKRELSGVGTVTGSGVYRQASTALQLKVHPYGQGMLNTINRAEKSWLYS